MRHDHFKDFSDTSIIPDSVRHRIRLEIVRATEAERRSRRHWNRIKLGTSLLVLLALSLAFYFQVLLTR